MNNELALEMKHITKKFGSVRVLDQVNFDLRAGETHALVGANGAGKSTLMKIIDGIYVGYEGEVLIRGKKVKFKDPMDAQSAGIAMIHQELDLVVNLDVASNIYMGREMTSGRIGHILKRKEMQKETQKFLDNLGFDLRADEITGDLSPAQQQLVLIARCVAMDASIIIMDEPTSSLSFKETEELFRVIDRLKKLGKSIIYISHFLEEVFRVSDRITVLRDGQKINTLNSEECSVQRIVDLMVGENKNIEKKFYRNMIFGQTVLEVKNYTGYGTAVQNISFAVGKGEVVGIAGVVGSGRTELVRTIFGADRKREGELLLHGSKISVKSPAEAVRLGIVLVPEDRKAEGIIRKRSVGDNLVVAAYKLCSKLGIIQYEKLRQRAANMMDYMHVVARGQEQEIETLSGGNQQKIVIGKWLTISPEVLIMDQPTRGIDVGAKDEIYELINQLAEEGTAILLISDELEELINLSDRILVMKKGQFVEEFDHSKRSVVKTQLLEAMVG